MHLYIEVHREQSLRVGMEPLLAITSPQAASVNLSLNSPKEKNAGDARKSILEILIRSEETS